VVRTGRQVRTIHLDGGADLGMLPYERAEQAARLVHELRRPLATVASALEILAGAADRPPDARVLDVAQRQIREGLRRVDQMLLVLRDDASERRLDVRPVNLRALAESLVQSLLPAHPVIGVRVPPELSVESDPTALGHVLDNLVRNAVQHSPPGTRIVIDAAPDGDGVLLTVDDEGPGIAPDDRESLFAPFRRGRDSSGTGLGLTVVSRFVAALRGRVWFTDPPGTHGTRACVWLPASIADGAASR
jgi:signal transduction histidine kinase